MQVSCILYCILSCILSCILTCILTCIVCICADEHRGTLVDEILGSDSGDDLNTVEDGDSLDDFGALGSEDEGDGDPRNDTEFSDDHGDTIDGEEYGEPSLAAGEAQAAFEIKFARQFLEKFGGEDAVLRGILVQPALRSMATDCWGAVQQRDIHDYMQNPYEPVAGAKADSYLGLRDSYSGPSPDALHVGDSPIGLFFFFLPVPLWQHIAACTNTYFREHLHERVSQAYTRYKEKRRRAQGSSAPIKRDIYRSVSTMWPIMAYEICRFMGLLLARTIAPNREKLSHHWKTVEDGGRRRDPAWDIRQVLYQGSLCGDLTQSTLQRRHQRDQGSSGSGVEDPQAGVDATEDLQVWIHSSGAACV